jgi:hypothetical protein
MRALHKLPLAAALLTLFVLGGCGEAPSNGASAPDVPHGYQSTLRVMQNGTAATFGPFMGYYFRPEDPSDLSRLRFVCFNEDGFYSSDAPVNAKLFEGTAVLTRLPGNRNDQPQGQERILPVFFDEAPKEWLETRPEPQDEFLHFHSMHDGRGARMDGYWVRHEAVADFTYDMGGRVEDGSPLYHRVTRGLDSDFARIVEFDKGPQ